MTTLEFWRHLPSESDEPDVLRGLGDDAAARRDARAMLAAGWALAMRTGLQADAFALLRGGFEGWRGEDGYDPALGSRFLHQLLGQLAGGAPPPDKLEPPGEIGPIATESAARCWIARELLGDGAEPVMERWLYSFVTGCARDHVEPESVDWARAYAARHDLPAPWM